LQKGDVIFYFTVNGNSIFCNNIAFILHSFPSYRNWIAAALLVLYAFIATPVQLWHSHALPVATGSAKLIASEQQKELKLVAGIAKANTAADHCSICSHQYAGYIRYDLNLEIAPESVCIAAMCNLIYFIHQRPHFLSSNKSPPAIV